MDVYLERGSKKAFAGAIDWPGWCRSARDEDAALGSLLDYGSRYLKVVGRSFAPPRRLRVVERVDGNASTDFGVPAVAPAADARPMDARELKRQIAILERCWKYFDRIASAAEGVPLRTGPRGGGRDLAKMRAHVTEGDDSYLRALGGGPKPSPKTRDEIRRALASTLTARANGLEPEMGPRRKAPFWTPRYTLRRAAWHILDHAWEIEDRSGTSRAER